MPTERRFAAALMQGHKGITAVIVPFDPKDAWALEPLMLDDRRYGWLVRGTMNGAPFDGWIGHRWGRHFIMVDAELRRAASVSVGDVIDVVIKPTKSQKALAIAREQAKLTTAPGRKAKR